MVAKEPVLLVVFIEPAKLRWFVAGIGLDGQVFPLLRSDQNNLEAYIGAAADEAVMFLRHRLSGVLQAGCDRLWAQGKKPCQIIFIADQHFDSDSPELTTSVAEHFVQWLHNPPVAFLLDHDDHVSPACKAGRILAGTLDPARMQALDEGWHNLLERTLDDGCWEFIPNKAASRHYDC